MCRQSTRYEGRGGATPPIVATVVLVLGRIPPTRVCCGSDPTASIERSFARVPSLNQDDSAIGELILTSLIELSSGKTIGRLEGAELLLNRSGRTREFVGDTSALVPSTATARKLVTSLPRSIAGPPKIIEY